MFRAIIIDDEQHICNLIKMLGDWNSLSIEITGTFYDAEDAFQFILTEKPDIIITDIKMPVYDGLELIRLTRAADIDSAFIIISGYRHFEYAHQAMQFGIVDYLLKPVNAEELNNTLKKICQNLSGLQARASEKLTYNLMMAERRHIHHQTLLKDLSRHTLTADSLEAFNAAYSTSFQYERFRILLMNTSVPQLHISNQSFQNKIADLLQGVFTGETMAFSIPDSRGIFCLINYPPSRSVTIFDDISRFYNNCAALTDIYGSFDLSAGVGDEAVSLSSLETSYLTSIDYERLKLILGWNRIISQLSSSFKADGPIMCPDKSLKNLQLYLECFNTDGIIQWFETLQIQLQEQTFPDIHELYQIRDQILKLMETLFADDADTAELTIQTNCARTIPEFILKLRKYILFIVSEAVSARNELELLPIRQAKEYIKTNYMKSITLEDVAEFVTYNPSYFSTSFKKHTGQTFSDYLTEVRITEAKHLLKTSQLSIIEIAECTGYHDSKYFRKIFKKLTGIKPSDYRKLYL